MLSSLCRLKPMMKLPTPPSASQRKPRIKPGWDFDIYRNYVSSKFRLFKGLVFKKILWCFLTALCRWWWWHYNLQHCESLLSTCWSFHWFQRRLFHHQQITTMQQALFWKFNSSQYREGSLFSCWIKSCEIFLNK